MAEGEGQRDSGSGGRGRSRGRGGAAGVAEAEGGQAESSQIGQHGRPSDRDTMEPSATIQHVLPHEGRLADGDRMRGDGDGSDNAILEGANTRDREHKLQHSEARAERKRQPQCRLRLGEYANTDNGGKHGGRERSSGDADAALRRGGQYGLWSNNQQRIFGGCAGGNEELFRIQRRFNFKNEPHEHELDGAAEKPAGRIAPDILLRQRRGGRPRLRMRRI